MPARQTAPCIICRHAIEISDAGAAYTMMVRLVGIPDLPRLYELLGVPDPSKSESGNAYMCVECCVDLAMGKIPPPTQPWSLLANELMSRMIAKNPAVLLSAWNQLRGRVQMPEVNLSRVLSDGGIIMPPPRALKAG